MITGLVKLGLASMLFSSTLVITPAGTPMVQEFARASHPRPATISFLIGGASMSKGMFNVII